MTKNTFASVLLLALFTLLFSGCFETEFNFKTIVHQDASVEREMSIDGRGGNLFKIPAGKGWDVKSSVTQGQEALLPATYYHVKARGKFAAGETIPPDYQFDQSKLGENWQETHKDRLQKAGILPPFEDRLFARNKITVHQINNFFALTTVYEEVFQNEGVIPLLMVDLKEEIRKQSVQDGEVFKEEELDQLARLRLEDEILPEIRFKSEVALPGKIISSNGKTAGRNSVEWNFSLKDFEQNGSLYTLRAVSRSLSRQGILALCGVLAAFALLLVLIAAGLASDQSRKNKKKRST